MADVETSIEALKATKPPETDRFTYLTLIETHLSPDILPTLNSLLQDAQLAQDIGWDLVEMLISLPGCEECLETIARLGNPRELIIKVLEVLEIARETAEDDDEDMTGDERPTTQSRRTASEAVASKFITLLGMLAILHKRIKTKRPSRFLATSLQTIARAYIPTQEMTVSVINLVRSLSIHGRPPLPTRKSSINVSNPELNGDSSRNAPDPEAEAEDPSEKELQDRMLLSFILSILESYASANSLDWSTRLLEFFCPNKVVPGKKTRLQAFKEDDELLARDAIVGQLVSLTKDLGLSDYSRPFIRNLCQGPIVDDLLGNIDSVSDLGEIVLPTGGVICLIAYLVFSSVVFEAGHPTPDMHTYPEHFDLMQGYMVDDFEARTVRTPGTVEGLVALGLWLQNEKRITEGGEGNYMSYIHSISLCAVFHPDIQVRNAASYLAGLVLHSNPDPESRLVILDDLLENCTFSNLKACAVGWLREELISAQMTDAKDAFSSTEAIDHLQYSLFPNLKAEFEDMGDDSFLEFWIQSAVFHIAVVNFSIFLFSGAAYKHVVPEGMQSAVEERYIGPLLKETKKLEEEIKNGTLETGGREKELVGDVAIVINRLETLLL